jgi:hypothetical protein
MVSFALGAIGSAYGGPVGAFVGSAVGSYIDSIIFAPDPVHTVGPRLTDSGRSADTPGAPIPIIWGEQNRVGTILAYTSGRIETLHTTEVKGGKLDSGDVSTHTEATYHANVMLVVGRTGHGGAFTSFPRIWGGPKLLYDATQSPTISRASAIRFALGSLTQLPDAMVEAALGAGMVPAMRGLGVIYIEGWQLADWGNVVPPVTVEANAGPANVQDLAADLCTLGNIPVADQSVGNLSREAVPGFVLNRLTSPRAALDILSPVYQFDMSDFGNKVKFFRRRRAADGLIFEEDLGTRPVGTSSIPSMPTNLASNRKLPREIILRFSDHARDLQINSIRTDRLTTEDTTDRVVDFPGTLTAAKAREVLDDLLTETYQAKREVEISIPPKYMPYGAGNIIRIRRPDEVLWPRFLITRYDMGANFQIKATLRPLSRQWAPRVAPATSGVISSQVIPAPNDSAALLNDLPFLDESTADVNGLTAAIGDTGAGGNQWLGANLYQSLDTTNYSIIARFGVAATYGVADTTLADGPVYSPDRGNTLDVTLTNGVLTSITEANWLESQTLNAALIGSEIINFRDATLISGTTYRLSGLKRGRRGTDWATGGHGAAETFVLLTATTVKRIQMPLALLNQPLDYKAVTIDQDILAVSPTTVTIGGVWATPFSGQDAEGARDGSNNLTITWTRRDRRWFDSWIGAVPMSEATEAYEVDIMSGATVLRTISVTAESASYSAAEQTTDGGTPGDPVEVNIYQISAVVGRGYALNATV